MEPACTSTVPQLPSKRMCTWADAGLEREKKKKESLRDQKFIAWSGERAQSSTIQARPTWPLSRRSDRGSSTRGRCCFSRPLASVGWAGWHDNPDRGSSVRQTSPPHAATQLGWHCLHPCQIGNCTGWMIVIRCPNSDSRWSKCPWQLFPPGQSLIR